MSVGRNGKAATAYIALASLQRGLSLVLLVPISFVMDPAAFGSATLLTTTAMLITTVLAAPMEQFTFRAAVLEARVSPSHLRVVRLYCIGVLPLAMLPVAGIAWISPGLFGVPGPFWSLELVSVAIAAVTTTFALPVARARQSLSKFAIISLSSAISLLVAKLAFVVFLDQGVFGWVLADLVSAIVTSAVAVAIIQIPKAAVTRRDWAACARFSMPLVPHRAAFWALASISRPAMAAVGTLDDVGYLSFALSLAAIASMLLAEVNNAFLPSYAREKLPAPTTATADLVKIQLCASFVLPALVGAGVGLAGPWIFGADYLPSIRVAGILLIGQVAYGIYLIPMNYLVQTAGMPRFASVASVAGAATILAGILLFGGLGVIAVAWITSAGYCLMAIIAFGLARVERVSVNWSTWLRLPVLILALLSLPFGIFATLLLPYDPLGYVAVALCVVFAGATGLVLTARKGRTEGSGGD